MLPHKEFVEHPEKYQPLGSYKSLRNKESDTPFADEVDLEAVFLSKGNLESIAGSLYKVAKSIGNRSNLQRFYRLVPLLAKVFAQHKNLNGYSSVDVEAVSQENWVESLSAINSDFMKYCYDHLKWNKLIPTRAYARVGAHGKRVEKKFNELTAEDKTTLDVWRHQEVKRMNKHFRDNNAIPVWQRSMHTRHYDRGNEGLAHGDPDRASLENFQRGFEMERVHDKLSKWTREDWYGI